MGQMLTAKQVAEVKGCSYQYVKRIIKEGKLQAQEILNDKNRKTYLVPLEKIKCISSNMTLKKRPAFLGRKRKVTDIYTRWLAKRVLSSGHLSG